MNFNRIILALGLVVLSAGFLMPVFAANITYTEDQEDFPNPERGFLGGTVRHKYVELGSWKNSALPQSFLDGLEKTFNDARNRNIKLIPRFRYTQSEKNDASLQQMLAHIDQLTPVLQQNYDVITILEAGFIGAYGEWWGSSNVESVDLFKSVLFKLLDAMPKERMVAVRYNARKRAIFGSNAPVTAAEAFQGSHKARTAAQNDCFITNEHDAGTYRNKGDLGNWGLGYEEEKVFMSADNLYVSQNGETCREGQTSYASCTRALTDMKRMKWDILNDSFNEDVLDQWRDQGCFDEISRRLGYRIRLLNATLDADITDGNLDGTLTLRNEGFGKIFNPRKLEMVFKNTQSGAEFVLPLPQDPRFWSPGLDHTLNLQIPIPKTLPFGSYALYLSLQDPAPKLYGKPQYAIRLANKDVWQSSKGYNSLNHTVKVSSFNPNPNSLKEGQIHRNSFEISKRVDAQLMGSVGIDLVLVSNTNIELDVFDMAGKRIVELANGLRSAGSFQILWKGMNQDGRLMPEGVYFITLRSDGKQQTRRVFLRK